MKDQYKVRINLNIKAPIVRVIDENKEALGIFEIDKAIQLAQDRGMDLIEMSPNAEPPVCKISDFGKFKYEMQKRINEIKKKQKTIEIKEIKVRPTIADGDYIIKLKNAKRFLEGGNKVRISLAFKGREVTHNEVGFAIMERFKNDLEQHGKIYSQPKMEGRQIIMLINPA